jgi:hypothetical protein
MSNIGLNSSLLTLIQDSLLLPEQQLMADLNQLAQDLTRGNLPAAQQDYVTLSQDIANPAAPVTVSTIESGVTVTLLSDLSSLPIGPPEVSQHDFPQNPGLPYIDLSWVNSSSSPKEVSPTGIAATDSEPLAGVNAAPQPLASNTATPAAAAGSPGITLANAGPGPVSGNAAAVDVPSQRASGSPTASLVDQGSQAAAVSAGTALTDANPLPPGLTPDASGMIPWNLYEWQLSSYRAGMARPEFPLKRKNPRGSAARTRAKRRKP